MRDKMRKTFSGHRLDYLIISLMFFAIALMAARYLVSVPVVFGASTPTLVNFHTTLDSPTITITTGTADSTTTPTTTAKEAQIQWKFGTVVGSFTTCTVQSKTSYDGTNYLTLGSAATVTVSTGTVNAWTVLAQAPTTSVTTSSASSTVALGFGLLTKYTFACSGGYGTSAPATISVIYR
jgi:hypothetical protein